MSFLLEFKSAKGPIIVEAEEDLAPAGVVRAAKAGQVIKDVSQTIEQALDTALLPIAMALRERLDGLEPAHAEVTFGLKFTAEAGVVISRVAGEASIEIKLTWGQKDA